MPGEKKLCPKCKQPFLCEVNNIANCQCNSVSLSEPTRAFLSKTNFECLCKDCLIKIEEDIHSAKTLVFPSDKIELIEDVHFYIENGKWVFTETYHYLRGYCCESGCRHCVYGFVK